MTAGLAVRRHRFTALFAMVGIGVMLFDVKLGAAIGLTACAQRLLELWMDQP